ncbi:MAG: winged helix-turn-helix domain-containing protein [Pseudomonadota bacterium]
MREYRFAEWRFDALRLELRRGDELVALRPKTAVLMGVLLAHTGQAVSKADLIERVWQRSHVQDQSLFQAISELRAALKPLDAIRTHPNLGYAWVHPLNQEVGPTVRPRLAYAAGLALMVLANAAAWLGLVARPVASTPIAGHVEATPMLPALQAFSIGMEHLEQDRFSAASEFFALASQEHPAFLEAQLMAAEASLAEGNIAAAREQANTLMQLAQSQDDGYLLVAALDVLSRAALAQGRQGWALDLARSAAGNAREAGYACAAMAIEARVESIAMELGLEAPGEASAVGRPNPPALADDTVPTHCAAITPRTSQLGRDDLCLDPILLPTPYRRREDWLA